MWFIRSFLNKVWRTVCFDLFERLLLLNGLFFCLLLRALVISLVITQGDAVCRQIENVRNIHAMQRQSVGSTIKTVKRVMRSCITTSKASFFFFFNVEPTYLHLLTTYTQIEVESYPLSQQGLIDRSPLSSRHELCR